MTYVVYVEQEMYGSGKNETQQQFEKKTLEPFKSEGIVNEMKENFEDFWFSINV